MAEQKITTQKVLEAGWDEDQNGKRWEDYETIVCPDGTVIDMVNLLEEQHRAMAALTHLAPMFGGFISKLRFIYTFHVRTQATDGFNIFVNPQFTNELDFTGKCFVMAHELMHCLLNHMRRGKGHDHERSNIAADYEVNVTLADIGLFKEATMKKLKAYIDMKYRGWGYEKIYDAVKQSAPDSMDNSGESKDAQKNQDKSQQGQQGSGGGSGNQQHSADYKAGWKQAIEDWKAGKITV
ncbi:MAG: hypothetical protein K2N48_04815 [Muribaculaceae bacterium]|nr:hypothetical protein [Muribaculaceae bacterium]